MSTRAPAPEIIKQHPANSLPFRNNDLIFIVYLSYDFMDNYPRMQQCIEILLILAKNASKRES